MLLTKFSSVKFLKVYFEFFLIAFTERSLCWHDVFRLNMISNAHWALIAYVYTQRLKSKHFFYILHFKENVYVTWYKAMSMSPDDIKDRVYFIWDSVKARYLTRGMFLKPSVFQELWKWKHTYTHTHAHTTTNRRQTRVVRIPFCSTNNWRCFFSLSLSFWEERLTSADVFVCGQCRVRGVWDGLLKCKSHIRQFFSHCCWAFNLSVPFHRLQADNFQNELIIFMWVRKAANIRV